MMTSTNVARHSARFRANLAHFLKNRRAKRPSVAVEQKARTQLQAEIEFLDKNGIKDGDTRDEVRKLLGNPYGEWGADSWLYPGPIRDQFYRIDFRQDRVSARYFATIYDAESGR